MTDGDGRARVLGRVASALANKGAEHPIVAAASQPVDSSRDAEHERALARRFREELALVSGEAVFVADESAVAPAIARIAEERGLGPATSDIASADYAIVRADALFADTGSALVIERSAERRLAPYLPRTCIVVAGADSLHPTMSVAALAPLHAAARGGDKGEAVIITGPSRTADIEKTLVLGAHGPRHLFVIVFGVSPDDDAATGGGA